MAKMSTKKKIWISLISLILVGACVAGIMLVPKAPQDPVFVYSFNMIGYTNFYSGSSESYGMVNTDRVQALYVSPTQSVEEILVYQGQEVKKGDVLYRYDTTLSDLELERKDLSIQQMEVNLKTAQAELKSLKSMKPMVLPDKEDEDDDKKVNKSPADPDMVGKIYNADTAKGTSSSTAFRVWIKSSSQVTEDMIKEYLAARDPSMKKEVYVIFGVATSPNSEYTREYGVRYKMTTFQTEADNVHTANELSAQVEPEFQLVLLNNVAPDQNTDPTGETTAPTEESSDPTDETTEPTGESTDPTGETTDPTDETTEPTGETTDPTDETTEPTGETTDPTDGTTEPTDEPSEPTETTAPPCEHKELAYTYADKNHEVKCNACQEVLRTEPCTDSDLNLKCDLCGGDVPCAHKEFRYETLKEFHNIYCKTCGEFQKTEACTDADADLKCDICQGEDPCEHKEVSYEYLDTNHEVVCKACQEKLGPEVCVDADADQKCDLCGGCPQHICVPVDQEDGTHAFTCRYCGKNDLIKAEKHKDADDDDHCDVCGYIDPDPEYVTVESISMRFFVPAAAQKDDDDIIWNSGYTSTELASMREAKQKEIDDLKFSIKMGKAELKIMEQEADSGEVTAEFDGVVSSVLEPDNAIALNAPMIKVTGGGGFYVEGSVSELDLSTIEIGQTVTVTSWETYTTYEGTITEIGSYPTEEENYYYGSTNVSFYPYKVFIDESADLQEGYYVSMTYETETVEEGILYLENAFIREENGESYTYVRGADGLLEKRTVVLGENDGYMTQVLSGLTEEDFLAFPYGKTVEVGAPTTEGTWDDLYGY